MKINSLKKLTNFLLENDESLIVTLRIGYFLQLRYPACFNKCEFRAVLDIMKNLALQVNFRCHIISYVIKSRKYIKLN